MARTNTQHPLPESPVVDSLKAFGAIIRNLRTEQRLRIDESTDRQAP